MTVKRTTTSTSISKTGGKNLPAWAKQKVKAPSDAAAPREPKAPPKLPERPVREYAFSTVGGVLRFPATSIGKVTGGGPVVTETEIDGRVAATSMGDPTRRLATIEVIASGRTNGGLVVSPVVKQLFAAWTAGRLVRVYGAFDRPGMQGQVWSLGEPTFSDSFVNGNGDLTHAMLSIPLSEWTPADSVTVNKATDAAARVRGKQAAKSTDSIRKSKNILNGPLRDLFSGDL